MNPVTGLALGRVGVGVVALGRPDLAATSLQLDATANPQLPYLLRLFGAREVALGAVTLLARGSARRNLVLAGILVDAADAATAVLGAREGQVGKRAAAGLAGPALGAVVTGVLGLRRR